LLSEEENTSDLVEPPTEAEMNSAITTNMRNVMIVVSISIDFSLPHWLIVPSGESS
jgi:[calcium/calmodulin-dependent protein kinase] kinase